MNHPSQQQQVPMQNQVPQNMGQQRQVPNPPQQQQPQQQRPVQGQQQTQVQYSKYDPQLCFFVLEKGKSDKTWEDVFPMKQHIPLQDLQATLTKTRKKRVSVKDALGEITSGTIRRLVNELVEEETQKLWELNKTLQWKIASVDVEWEEVKRSARRIKRVSVLMETEASGFPDPQAVKTPVNGAQGAQDPNKQMKQNGMGQGQQGPMPNQGGKNPQQGQNMGHNQQFEQQRGVPIGAQNVQGHPGAPPPPPPPPGHPGNGHPQNGHNGGHPLPPPPPGPHVHGGQHVHNGQPHPNMPGAYPRSSSGHMRGGQPNIEVVDPEFMHHQKHTRGGNRTRSSQEDSEEWDSTDESERSSRRSRGSRRDDHERDHKSKRSHKKKDRSQRANLSRKRSSSRVKPRTILRDRSRNRSRSRSQSRHRGHRKHRTYDADDYDSDIKYKHSSGSSSSGDSRRSHRSRHHKRRHNREDPLVELYREKRRAEAKYKSHRLSRDTFENSERGSQSSYSASTGPSSAHTTPDSVWDDKMRPHHRHSRQNSHQYPTQQQIYDDINRRRDHRGEDEWYDRRHDDYPHQPLPPSPRHRPHDTFMSPRAHQAAENPFTSPYSSQSPRHGPTLQRANTYAADADAYPRASQRYGNEEAYKMDRLAEALLDRMEEKQQRPVPLQRRYSTQQRSGGYHGADEWDSRYAQRGYVGGFAERQ